MKANIKLAADLSVEIEPFSLSRTVCLRTITGPDYGDGAETRSVEREINLSKSEARAIASALMGCAAEL